jgi:hypothetical protein
MNEGMNQSTNQSINVNNHNLIFPGGHTDFLNVCAADPEAAYNLCLPWILCYKNLFKKHPKAASIYIYTHTKYINTCYVIQSLNLTLSLPN